MSDAPMTDPPDMALPPRTAPPLDAPDAAALIDAVAAWLRDDLMPRTDGADRWTLRIAANALAVAAREVVDGPAVVATHAQRLESLGYRSERELCAAIRAGEEDERFDEILEVVAAGVADSLAIANPRYRP